MLNHTKLFITSLLVSSLALADVAPPVYLEAGTVTPYTGYLFSLETELANRLHLIDLDYYKALNASNDRLIASYKLETDNLVQQRDLYKQSFTDMSERFAKQDDYNILKMALSFLAGAVLTTAVVYGVNKASK